MERLTRTSAPPPGIPGWRRAPCLGCGELVVAARRHWALIAATLDGTFVMAWGIEPLLIQATDPDSVPTEDVFLMGVAHHQCVPMAYESIRKGETRPLLPTPLTIEVGDSVPELPYTLDRPTQSDMCPFCDASANLTREDVWPRWFSRFLRDAGWKVSGPGTTGAGIEIHVPVCGSCNNEWMSVLENDASKLLLPMMRYTPEKPRIALSTEDQELLSAWAIKTAFLIDAQREPVIPRGFLHRFALDRRPGTEIVVFLSACRPDYAVRASKRAHDFVAASGPTRNSPNGASITFSVFDVLFQVVIHFNGGLATFTDNRTQYRDALIRIWPRSGAPATWPPTFGFSKASFDDLVSSVEG